MNKEEAQDLLKRYANNECTPEERILIERWYLKETIRQDGDGNEQELLVSEEEMWSGTLNKAGIPPARSKTRLFIKLASAAAVLLFIGFGIYFYKLPETLVIQNTQSKIDAQPGGKKATLTLSDGSTIILDGTVSGLLARQGNIDINKTSEGQIIYDASLELIDPSSPAGYNTISTPRGGEYQVILPDGSKVWLNSASSIRFPTVFSKEQRNVTLTGEAYFEIAKNPNSPFIVSARDTKVTVLGTHFNLMAYNDEASLKTTLLEGSIKVASGRSTALIQPGQEASSNAKGITVEEANFEESLAWKNGYFYFKNTDVKTVMRQISRWYDVDIEYRAKDRGTVFSGKMYRNVKASKVLEMLTYFKVDFRIEDSAGGTGRRKIIIL